MNRTIFCIACVVLAFDVPPHDAVAQTADREITWRTYAAERSARVRVFPSDNERRPTTIVLDDRHTNGGPITDDATFVADLVARELSIDPTNATFVFRFTPASFSGDASENGKTLLLRATFGRTGSGALSSPSWRVLTDDGLDDLLDRASL